MGVGGRVALGACCGPSWWQWTAQWALGVVVDAVADVIAATGAGDSALQATSDRAAVAIASGFNKAPPSVSHVRIT